MFLSFTLVHAHVYSVCKTGPLMDLSRLLLNKLYLALKTFVTRRIDEITI